MKKKEGFHTVSQQQWFVSRVHSSRDQRIKCLKTPLHQHASSPWLY